MNAMLAPPRHGPAPHGGVRPAEEAHQTSGMTMAIVLRYVERHGGREAVLRALRRAGLAGREDELLDERSWWSWTDKQALFSAAAVVLDDPEVTRRAGEQTLETGVGSSLKVALRTLGSPELLYANVARANHKFSRNSRMEASSLGDGHATLRYIHLVDVRPTRLDCLFNVGILSCAPPLFGLPAASVSHPTCMLDGASECVYEVRWDARGRAARWSPRATLAGLVAALVGLVVGAVPVALAGAALAVAGALGWAYSAMRRVGRRQHQLEAELQMRIHAADALRESLHALASELDHDRLLSMVSARARDGLAGDALAVLLDDGDGQRVRRATGLPAGGGEALESWTRARPSTTESVILLDDLAQVPELAVLTEGESPLASLCAAPMRRGDELMGMVVALARRTDTFLPQDLEWLEAYAQQAAIALSNASLYTIQLEMARRDPLTGLLNHREFHEAVDAELARCRRYGGSFSVAIIDLDGFKAVNDRSGHAAGDALLRHVAAALESAGRATDVAFRVGGDEFALLLPVTESEPASAVVSRVGNAIAAADERVGASCGVAGWPQDGSTKAELLGVADAQLYAMKGKRPRVVRAVDAPASSH